MKNRLDEMDELAGVIIAFVLIIMLSALWAYIRGPIKMSYIEHMEEKQEVKGSRRGAEAQRYSPRLRGSARDN